MQNINLNIFFWEKKIINNFILIKKIFTKKFNTKLFLVKQLEIKINYLYHQEINPIKKKIIKKIRKISKLLLILKIKLKII